jgi:uncharacterized protein (DUF779 family)
MNESPPPSFVPPPRLGVRICDGRVDDVAQVVGTDAALVLVARLGARHGPLMFHQSGGCCDGSAPMCFPRSEFLVGESDILLGQVGGAPFFISRPQFAYWCHTQLVIDVVPGRGGMFSLDGPEGLRFLTRARLYEDDEWRWLVAHRRVDEQRRELAPEGDLPPLAR